MGARLRRLTVRVKAGAKTEAVERGPDGAYLVRVKAPPVEGKANDAVTRALAGHFGIPRSSVKLVRGQTAKIKTFELFFP